MTSSDYVQIAVPVAVADEVYRLIGSWLSDNQPPHATREEANVWNEDQLRTLAREASPRLRGVLRLLGSHRAGITSEEVLESTLGFKSGRSWGGFITRQQVFSRRRFGLSLPFDRQWDSGIGRNRYSMREDWAASLLRALDDAPNG